MSFVHICDCGLGVGFVDVEDIGSATIDARITADGEVQILDLAVLSKDFAKVVFVHILRQALDDNLGASRQRASRTHATRCASSPAVAPASRIATTATAWAATGAPESIIALGRSSSIFSVLPAVK